MLKPSAGSSHLCLDNGTCYCDAHSEFHAMQLRSYIRTSSPHISALYRSIVTSASVPSWGGAAPVEVSFADIRPPLPVLWDTGAYGQSMVPPGVWQVGLGALHCIRIQPAAIAYQLCADEATELLSASLLEHGEYSGGGYFLVVYQKLLLYCPARLRSWLCCISNIQYHRSVQRVLLLVCRPSMTTTSTRAQLRPVPRLQKGSTSRSMPVPTLHPLVASTSTAAQAMPVSRSTYQPIAAVLSSGQQVTYCCQCTRGTSQ